MTHQRAVFLSEWLANPYKKLLAEHLLPYGIEVEEYCWSLIFLPRVIECIGWHRSGILHLHALHPFLKGKNALTRAIKLLIFIAQILILRLLRIKTVWTVHEWTDKLRGGQHNIESWRAKVLGKFLHGVITHCNTTKLEVADAFGLKEANRVHVIPHGNYISSYPNTIDQHEARKRLTIPDEHTVFLLFGSIYRYKGVLDAIDAFQSLKQDQISFIIAGRPDEEGLEAEIQDRLNGFDNIHFIAERIPDEDVQIYMNACDCVVMPYRTFTTSGIAILAMSFGRACIAPASGFFSDVFDESSAILYDSMNPDGLVQAMKTAIASRERLAEMGNANLELANQWNWDYVARETWHLYQT